MLRDGVSMQKLLDVNRFSQPLRAILPTAPQQCQRQRSFADVVSIGNNSGVAKRRPLSKQLLNTAEFRTRFCEQLYQETHQIPSDPHSHTNSQTKFQAKTKIYSVPFCFSLDSPVKGPKHKRARPSGFLRSPKSAYKTVRNKRMGSE